MATKTKAVSLELGGIPLFLFGGANGTQITPPAYLDADMPPGETVPAINCIDVASVGRVLQSLRELGGIATNGNFTLRLLDFRNTLSKLFGATVEGLPFVHLDTTLNAEFAAGFFSYIGDGSFISDDSLIWIGQECVRATSVDDIAKTITYDLRGALGSTIRDHLVNNTPAKSFKPRITTDPCFYLGCPATVKVHEVIDGVADAGEEIFFGFLAAEPEPSGNYWVLTLASDIAKTSQKIGSGVEQTTLVENWIYNDPDNPFKLTHTELIPYGTVTGALGFGIQPDQLSDDHLVAEATLLVNSEQAHENVFGTARGNYPGNAPTGELWVKAPIGAGAAEKIQPVGYVVGDEGYTIAPFLVPNLTAANGVRIVNADVHKRFDTTLPTGLVRWPAVAVTEFNRWYNCTLTADGAFDFIDCALSQDGRFLIVKDAGYPDSYKTDTPPILWNLLAPYSENNSANLWYPWLEQLDSEPLEASDDGRNASNRNYLNNINLYRRDGRDVAPGGAGVPFSVAASKSNDEIQRLELKRPKLGFWQTGRRHLLVKDDTLDSNGGSLRVQAGDFSQIMDYDSTTVQIDADGNTVGYLVTLSDSTVANTELKSFGSTEQSKVSIAPYAILPADPRRALLQILLSGNTTKGYPSASYSVLPRQFGLSINPKRVDINGILSYPVANNAGLEPYTQKKPVTAATLLNDTLTLLGAHLVIKNINGSRKITLVKDRNYNKLAATATVEIADWTPEGVPDKGKKTPLVGQWSVYSDYDAETDKWGRVTNFFDTDVIDANNGVIVNPRTVRIQGLNVSEDTELARLYASLRDRYGVQAKIVTGTVLARVGKTFDVGDTINIKASRVIDESGSEGIDGLAFIVRHEIDHIRNTCQVVGIYKTTNRSGFAPEAEVTQVVDVDTVILSDNSFSPPTENDGFYLLGATFNAPVTATLRAKIKGAEAGNRDVVITGWDEDTNTATIVGHGLVVGDTLSPLSWADATENHKRYVFISSAGLLNGTDTGYRYA